MTVDAGRIRRWMGGLDEKVDASVILEDGAAEPWLDPEVGDPNDLLPLLHPYADCEMEAWPVTTAVGNIRNDFPELIERRDLSPS